MMNIVSIASVVLVCLLLSKCSCGLNSRRLCVLENRIANNSVLMAFRTTARNNVATLDISYGHESGQWGPWISLGAPLSSLPISNPTCDYAGQNQAQLFVQASDGQVYVITQDKDNFEKFSAWIRVGTNLIPSDPIEGPLVDPVSVAWYHHVLMVFARSMSKETSRLYWCKGDSVDFGSWGLLAGSSILGTDATFIKNPFTGKFEGFMLSTGGKIHRTWQHNANAFAGWKTMAFAPTFSTETRPVAHVMGYDFKNGKLTVGGIGKEGYVRLAHQTTCDSVDNPWSYCTWSGWSKGIKKIQFSHGDVKNNLFMSRNIHYGIKVFITDHQGQLWQAWQMERGGSWHSWDKVPQNMSREAISGLLYFRIGEDGWWVAHALNSNGQMVTIHPPRSMSVKPSRLAWGDNCFVSWSVPVDEASRKDWIGIYPKGSQNDAYVDYRYVQGGLNPGGKAVPEGDIAMASYLPDGSYDVRYLVNRNYVSVMDASISSYNMSKDSNMIQLYRGLLAGMGHSSDGIEHCVDEAKATITIFKDAFVKFKEKEIYVAIQLLGTAIEDVAKTLNACLLTDLARYVEKIAGDFLRCVLGNCASFVIDLVKDIVILFRNRYEIYGDIQAASNSFNRIQGYQQGGLCIGRMVKGCLSVSGGCKVVIIDVALFLFTLIFCYSTYQ